jgi:hypothetical protein
MSGYYFCNLVFRSDKSGWDLAAEELERTCPTRGPGSNMSSNSF